MSKLILVVEDSPDFQMLLTNLLEGEGYRVLCAGDGQDALEKLHAMDELPSLVLLDLMMPVMDGFEFKRRIAVEARLAHLPIVIMTAHGDIQMSKIKIGAREALRKPLELNKMLAVVESVVQ